MRTCTCVYYTQAHRLWPCPICYVEWIDRYLGPCRENGFSKGSARCTVCNGDQFTEIKRIRGSRFNHLSRSAHVPVKRISDYDSQAVPARTYERMYIRAYERMSEPALATRARSATRRPSLVYRMTRNAKLMPAWCSYSGTTADRRFRGTLREVSRVARRARGCGAYLHALNGTINERTCRMWK